MVRELFEMARSKKACIIFFDEIDAIGGARFDDGAGETDGHVTQLSTAEPLIVCFLVVGFIIMPALASLAMSLCSVCCTWLVLILRFSISGGDNEVQRTMLELINQLDGFDPRGNIKVLMATNR